MLRVYLDQFAWIRLARAAHQVKVEAGWAEALAVARYAHQRRLASFPIDIYRYWETSKNHAAGPRNRLADTIVELSDFDALILPTPVLDYEIDAALHARLGRPARVEQPRIFGRGITHMSNGGVSTAFRLGNSPLPAGASSDIRDQIDQHLEETLLRAGPDDHARVGQPLDTHDFGGNYVQHELKVASDLATLKLKGDKLRRAVVETDLADIGPVILRRLDAAHIPALDVLNALGHRGLLDLVDALPTRRVTNNLRVNKHRHPSGNQGWEANDFFDIVSLPVPAVYCDVVLTEKRWVDSMKRDGLDEVLGTKLISTPDQLVQSLMSAA